MRSGDRKPYLSGESADILEDQGGQNIPEANKRVGNSGACAGAQSKREESRAAGQQGSRAAGLGLWRAGTRGFR